MDISEIAAQLGKRGAGIKKTMSPAALKQRRNAAKAKRKSKAHPSGTPNA